MSEAASTSATNTRKRRPHRKSRGGCANCKIRRVKCDEEKPSCQRCLSFNVSCSYGTPQNAADAGQDIRNDNFVLDKTMKPNVPVLELRLDLPSYARANTDKDGASNAGAGAEAEMSPPLPVLSFLSIPLADGTEHPLPQSTPELLQSFSRNVRILSLHGPTATFKSTVFKLITTHGYRWILHFVFALALIHQDGVLPTPPARFKDISFHHHHARAILFLHLAIPFEAQSSLDRDALWAAIALMCHFTFSAHDIPGASDAWPVRRPESQDLAWVRQCQENAAMFDIVHTLGVDSMFGKTVRRLRALRRLPTSLVLSEGWGAELDGLPKELAALLDLNPGETTATGNPYHTLATVVALCLECEKASENILMCFAFLRAMDARFQQLLYVKDLPALVLMAWWYARLVEFDSEEILRRARVEGQAICVYVESWGHMSSDIMTALEYPKKVLGVSKDFIDNMRHGAAKISLKSSLYQHPHGFNKTD
ncbi:Sterol uptake control protein 2 [Ceratocystis fimbriata CBS 114723]|uniref:Sterol uptake control protein 2 n=1 Tax=Ceratocystis fimbriata CBS 114723 TaxID=1035309 RepID=A0A2C5X0Y2_9PEZI|nr:Sterol uptake control protein 2 [Ceratocystis fimbriata CBS 114723]